MNSQNILKYYNRNLDVKLDTSEFYDYQIDDKFDDIDLSLLNYSEPINYNLLKIEEFLNDFSCERTTIKLDEYNYQSTGYTYSGLTLTISYSGFTSYFSTSGISFNDIILNNNIFIYTGITNEIHYFKIVSYNGNKTIDQRFLTQNENIVISGFSKNIIDCIESLNNQCCNLPEKLRVKPWAYKIAQCNDSVRQRTEEGWTLDFVFNKESSTWSNGGIFYYLGVRGENDTFNYGDNNLSFGFTSDGKIKWQSIHYSGTCDNSGYTESFYITSGITKTLPDLQTNKDFNVTITFERYQKLDGLCDIVNEGGINDLITGHTGTTQVLNSKWFNERNKRLGKLKIYLNAKLIYTDTNWEEIIPINRGKQPLIQSWGGGTLYAGGIHNGLCCFNLKRIKYFETPLSFTQVNHHYLTTFVGTYEVSGEDNQGNIIIITNNFIVDYDNNYLVTQDDEKLIYR